MKITKKIELLFLGILSLTPLLWLKGNEIVLGHDSGFRLDQIAYFKKLLFSWDPSYGFGMDWSVFKGFLIAQIPELVFTTITQSLTVGQILTFIFWFFLMLFSMYYFLNTFFGERKFWSTRILGSILYGFNFFILQAWFIAERSKFSVAVALPIGLVILYKTFRKEYSLVKGVIFFNLILFLFNGGGNPTMYGSLLVAYGVWIICLLLFFNDQPFSKKIKSGCITVISIIVVFLLVNAYWILPQVALFKSSFQNISAANGGVDGILMWEKSISKNASITNLLRMQGMPDWYENPSHPYSNEFLSNPILIFASFLPITIIIVGFVLKKNTYEMHKERVVIYSLLLLFFVSIIFIGGAHQPFGFVYLLFVKYIPGFTIFRSAFYKFGIAYFFSISALTSIFFTIIITRIHRKYLYSIVAFVIILGSLAYHYPFFIRNFFEWEKPFSTKVNLPSYVPEIASYINSNNSISRILLLPRLDPSFEADMYEWGFWSLDLLPTLFTNKSIIANTLGSPAVVSEMYSAIAKNDEEQFLFLAQKAGVNAVLLRKDAIYSDLQKPFKKDADNISNLQNFKSIKEVKKAGAWSLYTIIPVEAPLVKVENKVVYVKTDKITLKDIYQQNIHDVAIVDATASNPSNVKLPGIYTLEAVCVVCDAAGVNAASVGRQINGNVLLSDSIFYPLEIWKDNRSIKKFSGVPQKLIDVYLEISSRKIGEIRKIISLERASSNRDQLKDIIKAYKFSMSKAMEALNNLNLQDKNQSELEILFYLNSHFQFLQDTTSIYEFHQDIFNDLAFFMQSLQSKLNNSVWVTDFPKNIIKYFVNVDKDALYSIELDITNPNAVVVDGSTISNTVFLTKGIHRLSVELQDMSNLLPKIDSTLEIDPGKSKKYKVKNFELNAVYRISFDYKVLQGKPYLLINNNIGVGNAGKNLLLNDNGVWNSLSYMFLTSRSLNTSDIAFYSGGFNKDAASLELKNVELKKVVVPEVILSTAIDMPITEKPNISYNQDNTTHFSVHVKQASGPFILQLNQAFNQNWKLFIKDRSNYVEKNHVLVNGYSNGWIIDKKGDYNIIISYESQNSFYYGLTISLISILVICIYMYTKRHE